MNIISEKSLQKFMFTDDSFSLLAIDLFDKLTPMFLNNIGLFEKCSISFNIDNDCSHILVENSFFQKEFEEKFKFNSYNIMLNTLLSFEGNFVFNITDSKNKFVFIESFYCFFSDKKNDDDDIDDGIILIRGNYKGNLDDFYHFKREFCVNVAPELIKAYYRIFHYDEKIKNNKDFITRLYFEKINTLYHLKYSKEDIENYYLKYLENDNYNKDIVFEKLNYAYKRFYNESE